MLRYFMGIQVNLLCSFETQQNFVDCHQKVGYDLKLITPWPFDACARFDELKSEVYMDLFNTVWKEKAHSENQDNFARSGVAKPAFATMQSISCKRTTRGHQLKRKRLCNTSANESPAVDPSNSTKLKVG